MKFIKLTDRFSDRPIFINSNLISAITRGENTVFLYLIGDGDTYFQVSESPEEIISLINKEE